MHSDGNTPMIEGGRLLAGRYKLLEKIGEGGAAEVFRARDQHLGRLVAVKLLRPQFASDPQSRDRFAVEARAVATLSHPNIVDIFDFGEVPDGSMYIVMQFVEGGDLKDILRQRGRMSPGETIAIAQQVCGALSAAHTQGLIHRDVKPQNILIDSSGNARLTDFGVVKALSAPALTQSGMTFGTAAYLSPEQATGAAIGPASDIYSLGCVMYEMLAGAPPFTGDNAAVVAYKQVWERPRPLHDMVPEVPPSLETIVMRCLNKEPEKRYPSADMLSADLERLNTNFNQPTQAIPLGTIAAAAASAGEWTPVSNRPRAELSQAIPMPLSPNAGGGGSVGTVPPVRAQTTRYEGGEMTVSAQHMAPTLRKAYAGPVRSEVAVVNADRRRGGVSGMLLALAVLAVLGLVGFGIWRGMDQFRLGTSAGPSPTPLVAGGVPSPTALPSPTPRLGGVVVESPGSEQPTPTPIPPTMTTTPPPQSTDTPAPTESPSEPTATPGQAEPTPTVSPVPASQNTITLDDTNFTGGFTNKNGRYHGRTAQWVYGQGTAYNTMATSFNLDVVPDKPASLTVVGVDSEDEAKTPIRIMINGAVIYEGPDPLPNDSRDGPGGKGNWGAYTWELNPGVLQQGINGISIENLDPSDKINYPLFFMLDYATISWGE